MTGRPRNVLFLCGKNGLRSPTAEQVFAGWPGIEVLSAGLNHDAVTQLDAETVEWADLIFVMEKAHRKKLQERFRKQLKARVVCLDIPDDFEFMQPELVEWLKRVVPRWLPAG